MEVLLIYGGIALLGVIVYLLAVQSRKSYTCPNCGEKLSTEYLDADRCGVCGTKLNQDKDG